MLRSMTDINFMLVGKWAEVVECRNLYSFVSQLKKKGEKAAMREEAGLHNPLHPHAPPLPC